MRRSVRWLRPILWLQLSLVLLIAAAGSVAWAEDRFVTGINDLPLMTGLSPLAGQGVVFDAPGGRIVEAWAEGAVSRASVLTFYGSTLPQLGWTAAKPDLFRRDGETLRLEFPRQAPRGSAPAPSGALLIRFYLSPG